MHFRILPAAVITAAALTLAAPAGAFELTRAKTEAELLAEREGGAQFIRLNFRAELISAVPPDPIFPPEPVLSDEIVIGWGAVGGIQPQPFMVLIPAGCFVDRGGFRVEEFEGCEVVVSFDDGASTTDLEIRDFDARIRQHDNGTAVMDVEALVADPSRGDLLAPGILAALGGLPAEIEITTAAGDVMAATARVLKTEALSGIDPTPF